jgi:AcrR family transcriptional regulator
LSKVIENPQELILNKAKEILCSEGYSKLNMRSIARSCDIAIGTIYNYYPTKKELIIEMMIDYWKEYFIVIDNIINSEDEFYIKLSRIFNELSGFIKRFKSEWLKPELYDKPDYVQSGVEKEYIYMEKLVTEIEKMLLKEAAYSNINFKFDTKEIAKFIIMNFITMVQTPIFQYSSFENFLKELLK